MEGRERGLQRGLHSEHQSKQGEEEGGGSHSIWCVPILHGTFPDGDGVCIVSTKHNTVSMYMEEELHSFSADTYLYRVCLEHPTQQGHSTDTEEGPFRDNFNIFDVYSLRLQLT